MQSIFGLLALNDFCFQALDKAVLLVSSGAASLGGMNYYPDDPFGLASEHSPEEPGRP